jgi:hypothetical protein
MKDYCDCPDVDFWRPLLSTMEGYRIHDACQREIRLDYECVVNALLTEMAS